jgi:branched-chain amino acid transport system ATP-binding protein
MTMLDIQGLACAYGKIEALREVSLSAKAGEVTCLLGPNGAGKTTLMMTLAGILQPTRGRITFEGENLLGLSPAQIVDRGLALVPENRLVFPALSVLENLMAGAYRRKDRAAIASDIEHQLDRFPRLRERIDQLAGTLSGGEQQMLALARALMSRPRLLLMDEPSVGLAPKVVAEIFGIVRQLHAEGTSIFLVEQNVHMALKVAQHFFLLQQGRVTFSGTPADLAEDDVIQRAYLAGSGHARTDAAVAAVA